METKGTTCLALLFIICSVVGAANPPFGPTPKTFDELVKILQLGNAYQRAEAVSRLARIDDARVVPTLIGLLEDPNDRVRIYTAQQLSYLADERAADALAGALSDSARNVRRYAGEGLIKIGSERHVPALVASVVSHLPGTTGDGYESTYLAPALEAIGKLSPQAPGQIVGLLDYVSDGGNTKHEDWWRFLTNVATCLGQIGDRAALDALERAAESLEKHHQDYNTWYAVRKAVAAIDPVRSPFDRPGADILATVRMGKITEQGFRQNWVLPLAKLGSKAVDDLAWALWFDDRTRTRVAIDALGEIRGAEVADVLRRYLQRQSDLSEQERRSSRFLVRRALLSLLKAEASVATAQEVAKRAGFLDDFEKEYLVSSVEKVPADQLPTEVRITFFDSMLEAGDRYAGPRAAAALGRIGGPAAGDILRQSLLSDIPPCRAAAARALGAIADYDALKVLLEASGQPDAPIGAIAWALGNIADPRAIPALEAMSNRDRLGDGDRLWIAAALAWLGHDYEANAALIRAGLPQTIRYAAWLNDGETVAALAKLIPLRDRGDTYIIDTLVAMGTAEALDALMSLADAETDPLRFQNLCKAAGDLGERLKHPEGQRYRAQAKVAVAVRGLFAMAQRAQPAEVSRRKHDLIDKYPQLARRIWIIEATRRLNLALRPDHKPWECVIPHRALRFADRAFDPEMIPVLKRFIAEDTQTVSHHGKDGVVPHYHYRSLAAAILAEKTGKQVTFVDIDGRAHPGGWRPPSAIDPGDASIQQ